MEGLELAQRRRRLRFFLYLDLDDIATVRSTLQVASESERPVGRAGSGGSQPYARSIGNRSWTLPTVRVFAIYERGLMNGDGSAKREGSCLS